MLELFLPHIQYTFNFIGHFSGHFCSNCVKLPLHFLSHSMQQQFRERENSHAFNNHCVCGHGGLMHELQKPWSPLERTTQHSLFNQIKSPRTMAGNLGLHHWGRMSYPDNYIGIERLRCHRVKILPLLKLLSTAAGSLSPARRPQSECVWSL